MEDTTLPFSSPADFKPLRTLDEYSLYFNELRLAFEKLQEAFIRRARQQPGTSSPKTPTPAWQLRNAEATYETGAVSFFLSRMLYTLDVFRKKYTYNPAHTLQVDLTDSGFPGFMEIDAITTDLRIRDERLREMPSLRALKKEMLDYMLRYRDEPEEILCRVSERASLEALDPDRMFLTFTPGPLPRLNETGEKFRNYTFSWACYDFATNRPYIHIMIFDQDITAPPLENRGHNWQEFLEAVQSEGSRAPGIGVIALGLDTLLKEIHPKVIKRICIGPLCSRQFSRTPENLVELLDKKAENEEDFILLFDDEIIFSSSQVISKSIFSYGQVREIFHIPETDLACYERKASIIHRHMIAPHNILQHMDFSGDFREYADCAIITYDKEGGLYV